MTFAKKIVCPRCRKKFPVGKVINLCPCGSPLSVEYDLKKIKRSLKKAQLKERPATLWRYREFLPLRADKNRVSLGEGFTPLVEAPRLAAELNVKRVGGGTGLIGMWKAFAELDDIGWIGARRPRMVSVQAEHCAPIVRAFREGKEKAEPWADAHTIASGLRVPQAVADFLMLRVIRESKGTALAVSDQEMVSEIRRVGRLEGLFFCPEGGAGVAALRRLSAQGWIKPSESVLLFNTASGLKYLDVLPQGVEH
jgi:threonine synthase